jgi:hypothetical protein
VRCVLVNTEESQTLELENIANLGAYGEINDLAVPDRPWTKVDEQ